MSKRTDKEDTIELAIHWLMKLQSEGYALTELHQSIDYEKVGKHELPVWATLTVKMRAYQ
jgi:hypothetical protein